MKPWERTSSSESPLVTSRMLFLRCFGAGSSLLLLLLVGVFAEVVAVAAWAKERKLMRPGILLADVNRRAAEENIKKSNFPVQGFCCELEGSEGSFY